MSEALPSGAPAQVRLAPGPLGWARLAEQLALGAASLAMAARIGPVAFAPLGILLIINSLAVTLSDFGVGLRVMRLPEGAGVRTVAWRKVRAANSIAVAAALVLAASLDGDGRVLVAAAGLLWGLSSVAYVRKAAALRAGASRRVAGAEMAGSAALLAAVVGGLVWSDAALVWLAGGLVSKHVVEGALVGSPRWALIGDERAGDWVGLWGSQAVAYVIANIDFLLVGLLLSDRALAVYVLAFRVAGAIPSQVAFVAARIATVDLASSGPAERSASYVSYCRRLFFAGVVGSLATAAAAAPLERLLGGEWAGLGWCMVLLAIAGPWRIVLGLAGTLAIVSGAADRLLRWELLRLVVTGAVLAAAAAAGLGWLVAGVVVLAVGSVLVLHHLASDVARLSMWNGLVPAAVGTAAATAVLMGLAWSAIGSVG